MHRPRILIESAWFPPFGFATTEISSNSIQKWYFRRTTFSIRCQENVKMHRPRILIESAWFPPFGFATTEISSNSIENISFFVKLMEENGRNVKKGIPKAAYRCRMAHVMHIISLRVRPKRVHKQNIFISPTYL